MLPANGVRVYLALGATDMRKSIDGLSILVSRQMQLDPFAGHLFGFCNRSRTIIKLLYWDGDGFALFYKRLERGRYTMGGTDTTTPSKLISREELMMLLEGLSFKNMNRKKRYKHV